MAIEIVELEEGANFFATGKEEDTLFFFEEGVWNVLLIPHLPAALATESYIEDEI